MSLNKVKEVSIIVPVYNVEKYLDACIKSILLQTYSQFELILIDDGSYDKSGEICDKYKELDNRIKVIHQLNRGQSSARNVGVMLAETEWILFIDSDDIVHPQMLEFLVRAIEESGANMSVCRRIQESIVPADFYRERKFQYQYLNVDEEALLNMYNGTEHLNNIYWLVYPKLLRTSIIKEHLFCEGKIFEDNEVSCKWLFKSKNIAILSEDMYFYTTNPTGTMQSEFNTKKLDYLWALEQQIEFYHQIRYKKMWVEIIKEYFQTTIWMCKCVNEELHDEKTVRKVMRHAELVYKKWSIQGEIQVEQQIINHIRKYAHPFKYRIKRKLLNVNFLK